MTPTEFELFTKSYLENKLKSQGFTCPVKHKVKLTSLTNNVYEIDLHYEFEVNQARYLTLVECKYWNSNVTREKVNAFKAVIDDLKAHKGIMYTSKAFQSGAVEYAASQGIGLFKLSNKGIERYSHFDGGLDDIYTCLVQEPAIEYSTANYSGLFFPADMSVYKFIIEKYGKEFALFLTEVQSGKVDLDNRDLKFPPDILSIIQSLDDNWHAEYNLIESAGLNSRLSNEQEIRGINIIFSLLKTISKNASE